MVQGLFFIISLFVVGANAAATEFSSYAAQMSEFDMIRDTKDLTKAQQDQIIAIYTKAKKQAAEFSKEKRKIKGDLFREMLAERPNPKTEEALQKKWHSLDERTRNSMSDAMKEISKIVKKTNLDRDYLYRAILREHRRMIPGFE